MLRLIVTRLFSGHLTETHFLPWTQTEGEERCILGFGGEIYERKSHLEDLRVRWGIILKWILKKRDRWVNGLG